MKFALRIVNVAAPVATVIVVPLSVARLEPPKLPLPPVVVSAIPVAVPPPLNDASVDVALLSQALHHATDPAAAVAEAARVLRPGGDVVVLDLREHDQAWVRDRVGDRLCLCEIAPRRLLDPEVLARTGGNEVHALLTERTQFLSDDLRTERFSLMVMFVLRAIADRARPLERPGRHGRPQLDHEPFVRNLVTMAAAAMGAPAHPLT